MLGAGMEPWRGLATRRNAGTPSHPHRRPGLRRRAKRRDASSGLRRKKFGFVSTNRSASRLGSFPQNDLLPVWVRFHQSIGLHQRGVRGLRKFGQAAREIVEIPPQLLEGETERE